jgi:AraC-like DNA-binding protein
MKETREFWRHPHFRDLGLLKARFTHHRYDLHTHPTYVVALITHGCERVRIGRHCSVAPAGTMILVNPEECHDGEPGAEGGWAYRTFYPSVSLLTTVANELGQDRLPLFPRAFINDRDLADAIAVAHESSMSADVVAAESSMLIALRLLVLRYGDLHRRSEPLETSGSRRRLLLYRQIIEHDLASELNLERLARAAGVTRFQVIRDFKKETGLTPSAFIRNCRARRAGRLIEQGLSLTDASFAAGFADQSHLSRTFRSVLGITPRMFQNIWFGCRSVSA